MFQTSSNPQGQRSLINLTFDDGKKMIASVKLPLSGKLAEALNNTDHFLDLITGDGEQIYVSKATVRKIEVVDPPKAGLNQQRRASDRASFNAYAVLGIDKNASKDEIRTAYLALVKSYHPDRFATTQLPAEMQAYASAMLARINLAYEQLMESQPKA